MVVWCVRTVLLQIPQRRWLSGWLAGECFRRVARTWAGKWVVGPRSGQLSAGPRTLSIWLESTGWVKRAYPSSQGVRRADLRSVLYCAVSAAPPCDRASGAPRGVWEAGDGDGDGDGVGDGSASTMRCDAMRCTNGVGVGGIEGVTRARG